MTKRSNPQNNSMHQYCKEIADGCIDQGITRKTIVEDLGDAEIPVTMKFVKEVIWKHYMVSMFGHESTTKLESGEVKQVEEAVAQFISENYGMNIEWWSQEAQHLATLEDNL